MSALAINEGHIQRLTDAVQKTKMLGLKIRYEENPDDIAHFRGPEECRHLELFLQAIINTASIEGLENHTPFIWFGEENSFTDNLGTALATRSWEKLSLVRLNSIPFRLADLRRFFQRSGKVLKLVTLTAMCLLHEDW